MNRKRKFILSMYSVIAFWVSLVAIYYYNVINTRVLDINENYITPDVQMLMDIDSTFDDKIYLENREENSSIILFDN
ncbi:hypothetical protein [Flammeovirga agarivorans]|uniref:Uncharacterized protein n=1 Tax=Flammeovirga agarivorans TaxID=2726742 RepID=A0A7X8SKN7_9BACT|nr:hypothetical protein [Flammeovirga agarivorans]NLR92004.1 hypothetical protein [Flammeovirga agarivorans]